MSARAKGIYCLNGAQSLVMVDGVPQGNTMPVGLDLDLGPEAGCGACMAYVL